MRKKNTSRALVARLVHRELLGPAFELHPTGLTVRGKPTIEEYTDALKRLQFMEGAIHWWYGDLCLAYEGHYGAIAEIAEWSPHNYHTIFNDRVVASRYELDCRQSSLSFEHHRIAAPLEDRLELIKGTLHWWYGDLCIAYEGHYGAIAEIADGSRFEYDTIKQDKWVAGRYKQCERSHILTFKHHLIAAPLEDRLEYKGYCWTP